MLEITNDSQFAPLTTKELAIPPASKLERFSAYVPVAGWFVSWWLNQQRMKPISQQLFEQVSLRSQFPREWEKTGVKRDVLESVAKKVAKCFSWPNHWFHPRDPMCLIMFDDDGGYLDLVAELAEIQIIDTEKISKLSESDIQKMQFVDFLLHCHRFDEHN
jgi:hypothetical protein